MTSHRYILVSLVSALFAVVILLLSANLLSASTHTEESWGWSNPQNMTSNAGDSQLRTALGDSYGNLHVLWNDNSVYPFTFQLLYRMRDASHIWSPIEVVPGVSSGDVTLDAIVDNEGTLHLIHLQGQHLFYSKKPLWDNWTIPITLTTTPHTNIVPKLAIGSSDTLHMVWGKYHYVLPPDASWTEVTSHTVDAPFGIDEHNVLHSVWVADGNIFYAPQTIDGLQSEPVNVSDNLTPSEHPVIALDKKGGVHFAWRDLNGPNNYGVFYRAVLPTGWTQSINLSPEDINVAPEILLEVEPDGTPHIVWKDNVGGYSHITQDDSGEWQPVERGADNILISPRGDVHLIGTNRSIIHRSKQYQSSEWVSANISYPYPYPTDIRVTGGDGFDLFSVWSYEGDIFYKQFYGMEINSITPVSHTNFQSFTLNIHGSTFFTTPQIYLTEQPNTENAMPLPNVEMISSTHIQVNGFSYFSPGNYYVTVENPDGRSMTSDKTIEIRHPAPIISDIIPTQVPVRTDTPIEITGDFFLPELTIKIDEFDLGEIRPISATQLHVTVPHWLPTGTYSLTVTNYGPGEPSLTIPDAIRVFKTSTLYAPVLQIPLDRVEADLPATEME